VNTAICGRLLAELVCAPPSSADAEGILASVTNMDSIMRYQAPDKSLILLDTIGLGDTEIDQKTVVGNIRDVALSARNGIDVLLFVMRHARITDDAIARLIYVTEYLWGTECLLNLYIVVTHSARYVRKKDEANEWIKRQVELNWRFEHIYKLVGENPNRFIFVDNPDPRSEEPACEERQWVSRESLMKALVLHPRDVVPPFTSEMMKKAKALTAGHERELERREQEMRELGATLEENSEDSPPRDLETDSKETDSKYGDNDSKSGDPDSKDVNGKRKADGKAKGKSKAKKKTPADEELRRKRAEARKKREEAEKALRDALADIKANADFEADASAQAEKATQRFVKDYESQKDPEGQVNNKKGAIPACKRMIGSFARKFRKGPSKADAKKADVGVKVQSAEKEVSHEAETHGAEAMEKKIDGLIQEISPQIGASAKDFFISRAGDLTSTLSPLQFSMFLNELQPGLERKFAGALWRRADANCDGQLDMTEFVNMFGSKGKK